MSFETRPLSDRERDWVFRLLYAHALNSKRVQELVHDLRYFEVSDELEWSLLTPANPYVEDLREGRLTREVWNRIESAVVTALDGILSNKETLEGIIQQASKRWRLARIGAVERSLLLLGSYEMVCVAAHPVKRVINRTVELAKRYGEADSKRFVNGILDQIRKNHNIEAD